MNISSSSHAPRPAVQPAQPLSDSQRGGTGIEGSASAGATHRAASPDVVGGPDGLVSTGRARATGPHDAPTARSLHSRANDAADGLAARIDYMIENGDLSDDQIKALEEAKTSLAAMMDRLGNAFFKGGNQPRGNLANAFHTVLDSVVASVHSAISSAVDPQNGPRAAAGSLADVYGLNRSLDGNAGASRSGGVDAVG